MGTLDVPVTNCSNLALNSLSKDLTAWKEVINSEFSIQLVNQVNDDQVHIKF